MIKAKEVKIGVMAWDVSPVAMFVNILTRQKKCFFVDEDATETIWDEEEG